LRREREFFPRLKETKTLKTLRRRRSFPEKAGERATFFLMNKGGNIFLE